MIKISDTIVLKTISLDDVNDIFNTINNQRDYLRVWLPFVDKTVEENDIFCYVENVIKGDDIQYSIYDDKTFLGLIGFINIDKTNKKAEIGYWLSEEAQGKGIMLRSVTAIYTLGFNKLDLNRIQIKVATENSKSRSIPERLGFRLEGIERDGELLVDNKFTDLAIYGLLKKEFELQCRL